MANTGLLGFNPYQRGQVIDISSKPTQLAIQLEQKEQAKNEALDKYFMDYDKNINPAGMRNVDIDDLLKMQTSIKQFYFKNKETIKKPELDGGKTYSQFMNFNKEMLSHVNQSKQESANAKVLQQALMQAKNKGQVVDDDVYNAIALSQRPLKQGYVPFDISKFNAYTPHSHINYLKELKNISRVPGKFNKKTEGAYDIFTYDEIPDLNEAAQLSNNKLQGDFGYRKYVSQLAQDPEGLVELGKIYKERTKKEFNPQSIEDVSLAYTLSNLPITQSKPTRSENPYVKSSLIAGRKTATASQEQEPIGNILDKVGSIQPIELKSGNKIYNGIVSDNKGNAYNGEVYLEKNTLPTDLYAVLSKSGIDEKTLKRNKGFSVIVENGRIKALKSPELGYIDRQAVENAQLSFNKEPKSGQQMRFGTQSVSTQPKQPQQQSVKKEINRADISKKAAAAGYSVKEYEKLLKSNGVTIKD